MLLLQVGKIISDITKVTEDLNVGFGSFIDKHLPPFASYYDEFNCEIGMNWNSKPSMNFDLKSPFFQT